MEKLSERFGPDATKRALRHAMLRMAGRGEAAGLQAELGAEREAVRVKHESWEQARDTRVAQTAEIALLDELLGGDVMDASRRILVATGGSRTDPRYVRAFSIAPSEGLAPVGGRDQARYVATVVAAIRGESTLDDLRPLADGIEARAAALAEAEKKRDDLYLAEGQAKVERDLAIARAQRAYNLAHPRLTVLYPDQAAWVESCFLDLRAAAAPSESSEPAPPVA